MRRTNQALALISNDTASQYLPRVLTAHCDHMICEQRYAGGRFIGTEVEQRSTHRYPSLSSAFSAALYLHSNALITFHVPSTFHAFPVQTSGLCPPLFIFLHHMHSLSHTCHTRELSLRKDEFCLKDSHSCNESQVLMVMTESAPVGHRRKLKAVRAAAAVT